jgi:hypothetical protein
MVNPTTIPNMDADPAPDGDRVLEVADPAGGAGTSYKVVAKTLIDAVGLEYGHLYTDDGSASQTPGASLVKYTGFETDGLSSANVTPTNADNDITCAIAGHYLALVSLSFLGLTNALIHSEVAVDGVVQPSVSMTRKLGGADVGNMGAIGPIDVAAGQKVSLFISASIGAVNTSEASLFIVRLGPT